MSGESARLLPLAVLVAFAVQACGDHKPTEAITLDVTTSVSAASLSASASSSTAIDVSWQDNTSNESGFEVYRSTSGANGIFNLLTTTSANASTYSDAGLSPATEYCYRARHFRNVGRKTTYGAF